MGNVGAAKDFFAAHCSLPRSGIGHYIAVIEDHTGGLIAISCCCDPVDDNARMLKQALFALTRQVPLDPASEAVIVSREDLRTLLSLGVIPEDVLKRLHEALGEATS